MRHAVRMVNTRQGNNFRMKLYSHMLMEKNDLSMIYRKQSQSIFNENKCIHYLKHVKCSTGSIIPPALLVLNLYGEKVGNNQEEWED